MQTRVVMTATWRWLQILLQKNSSAASELFWPSILQRLHVVLWNIDSQWFVKLEISYTMYLYASLDWIFANQSPGETLSSRSARFSFFSPLTESPLSLCKEILFHNKFPCNFVPIITMIAIFILIILNHCPSISSGGHSTFHIFLEIMSPILLQSPARCLWPQGCISGPSSFTFNKTYHTHQNPYDN